MYCGSRPTVTRGHSLPAGVQQLWRPTLCADVLLFFSFCRIDHPRHRKCLLCHDNIKCWLPVEKERGGHSSGLAAHQHRDKCHLSSNQGQGEETSQDSVLTPDPWTSSSSQMWLFYLQNTKATENLEVNVGKPSSIWVTLTERCGVRIHRCISNFQLRGLKLGLMLLSISTSTWCIFSYLPLWQGDSYCSVPQSKYLSTC